MRKEKIVITGGRGFLGTNATRRFLEQGFETHIICKREQQNQPATEEGLHVHEVDIRDEKAVADTMIAIAPDHVLHLAASNIQAGVITSSHDVISTNIVGTEYLLKASEKCGVKSFISIGSFLEYGPSTNPFREDMLCQPPEIYSISKLGQTLLVQSYGRLKKINTTVFRLFTPYGPHIQKGRLIENVIAKSLRGEDIHLTSKSVSRDFIFVDDIIDIFLETIARPEKHTGEIYNLGTGHSTSLEEVVRVVQQQTGTTSKCVWGEFSNVLYDTDVCSASMDKVLRNFSWRPKTSLEEGIAKTINSIKSKIDL